MLKIKDDVDLKELEKFGFKEPYSPYAYCYYGKSIDDSCARVSICKPTQFKYREIFFDYSPELDFEDFQDVFEEYQNILFDLIQAGLVEKVGE